MDTHGENNSVCRAVVFDMGDIFFDATHWRRSLVEFLRAEGIVIDYPELCRQWEAKLVSVYRGQRPYWDAFRGWMEEFGFDTTRVQQAETFAREKARQFEQRILFDGVAETLAALKDAEKKLAVLSDTESREDRVRQRLADLDIEQYFDVVVTSADIGYVKPEPEAYNTTLQRVGVSAQEAIFVGHDIEELDGAMRCGLTVVAFNCDMTVPHHYHLQEFGHLLRVAG